MVLPGSQRTSLRPACFRNILKILRAMIDGPYKGWKPTPEDWYRIKFGRVLYVDKDGLSSSVENGRGGHPELRTNDGYNQDGLSPTSYPHRATHPMGGLTGGGDSGTLRQQTLENDGSAGYGALQPWDLPPADSFTNSPSYSDSSGETNGRNGIDGARITGDSSSVLPMELMIYNDLITDIEGTARFLGHEFQNSVLFGPTPTSSPASAGPSQGQNPWLQSPDTMYGWVSFLRSLSFIAGTDGCDRFWEHTLYDNFLNQISKQAAT